MTRRRPGQLAALGGGVAVLAVLAAAALTHRAAEGTPAASPSAAASSAAAAPAAAPLGTCTFTDDPTSKDAVTDRDGKVVVVPAGRDFTVRVGGGAPLRATVPPNLQPMYHGVDAAGGVLGGDQYRPWVYRGGVFHEIPLPPGTHQVYDTRMNHRGDVALLLGFAGPSGELSGMQVAVWPADLPPALTVHERLPAKLTLAGITDEGMVAAGYQGDQRGVVAWLPDGTRKDLPAPGELMDLVDVNGDWVVSLSARWNVRTGSAEQFTGFRGERVDASGRVFGEAPNLAPPHPAVWVNGTVTLLPVDPARPLGMVGEVSTDGTRITSVLQADNPPNPRPVVWTCA